MHQKLHHSTMLPNIASQVKNIGINIDIKE